MGEVRLFVDDDDDDDEEEYLYPSSSEIICCRICHEAEFESSKTLEAPCSCSGTVKFAHRDCIQRWCDEKGNTSCEICLQKFEPGYSSAPPPSPRKPLQLTHHSLGPGISLEVPGAGREVNPAILAQQETLLQTEYADTSASICRFLGLTFTLFLLVRHLFAVFVGGTGDYPFTLLTLLVMRASGILLPMYIIMRVVDAIHSSLTRRYQVSENDVLRHEGMSQQHRVDID